MSILHISFSSSGGAGKVAQTLVNEQVGLGLSSTLLTYMQGGLRDSPFRYPILTVRAALDSMMVSKPKTKTLFSLYRHEVELFTKSKLSENGIIHLHWVEGVASHDAVRVLLESGLRVVWTIHDMAPFTGGCHQSMNCTQFSKSCIQCPQVRTVFRSKVEKTLLAKDVFQHEYENLRVVTPSKWMAERAQDSRVFRNQRVSVIPNPISQSYFSQPRAQDVTPGVRTSAGPVLRIVLVANDLDDPNKNIKQAVEMVQTARRTSRKNIALTLVGHGGHDFKSLGFVKLAGVLTDSSLIAEYDSADLLLSVSDGESFGLTIIEAAARGVPAAVLSGSGSEELISDGLSGWRFSSFEDGGVLLKKMALGGIDLSQAGQAAREVASRTHRPELVTQEYLRLYND